MRSQIWRDSLYKVGPQEHYIKHRKEIRISSEVSSGHSQNDHYSPLSTLPISFILSGFTSCERFRRLWNPFLRGWKTPPGSTLSLEGPHSKRRIIAHEKKKSAEIQFWSRAAINPLWRVWTFIWSSCKSACTCEKPIRVVRSKVSRERIGPKCQKKSRKLDRNKDLRLFSLRILRAPIRQFVTVHVFETRSISEICYPSHAYMHIHICVVDVSKST